MPNMSGTLKGLDISRAYTCLSDYISFTFKRDELPHLPNIQPCWTVRDFFRKKKNANGFPINDLIMSLLDRKNLEKKDVYCFSCSKRGKDAPGKFQFFLNFILDMIHRRFFLKSGGLHFVFIFLQL